MSGFRNYITKGPFWAALGGERKSFLLACHGCRKRDPWCPQRGAKLSPGPRMSPLLPPGHGSLLTVPLGFVMGKEGQGRPSVPLQDSTGVLCPHLQGQCWDHSCTPSCCALSGACCGGAGSSLGHFPVLSLGLKAGSTEQKGSVLGPSGYSREPAAVPHECQAPRRRRWYPLWTQGHFSGA